MPLFDHLFSNRIASQDHRMRLLHPAYILTSLAILTLWACTPEARHDTVTASSSQKAGERPSEAQAGPPPPADDTRPAGALSGDAAANEHADDTREGLRFAQARCAGCHAVTPGQISPNADAPPFASIAQRPGLSRTSAIRWLRQSHNFPDQMNFYLEPEQAEQLAAYLLSLREVN
jgi:mono/diheme cytochrome c family protein